MSHAAGALLSALTVGAALAGPGAGSAAATPAPSPRGLSLMAPPGVVTPSAQPTMVVRLLLPSGLNRNTASLGLTLYGCLGDRSAFDQTLAAGPAGSTVSSSGSVRVSSLPPDPADPTGAVDLSVPVHTGSGGSGGSGALGSFTAGLSCSSSEYGVYPLRLSLTEGNSTVGGLLTYLVYTDPNADRQPLRLGLVIPLQLPLSLPSADGTRAPPSAASIARLEALVRALSSVHVPVTLLPSPATVSTLASAAAPNERQALASITALAAGHQVLCGPFTSVDPNSLLAAGLSGELSAQVHQGASVLESALHANCAGPGTWVAQQTPDQSALDALASLGYHQIVLPQSSVGGPNCSSTCTRLFDLGDTRADSLPAAGIDPGLSAHVQSPGHSDTALAAQQAVTELEQIYFDAPNTSEPRGVVVVAPPDWATNPDFVSDLLTQLQGNPMVQPVTLNELFASPPQGIPVGGTVGGVTQPTSRRPAGTTSTSALPGHAIRTERARMTSFNAAVSATPPGAQVAKQLGQLLLLAESSTLSTKQQQAAVAGADGALRRQLRSFSVNASSIRLASNAAPVPITLAKGTPYAVTGVLGVRSDKLVFPPAAQSPGPSCQSPTLQSSPGRSSYSSLCAIDHNTNVVYVSMRTRATGNFRVSVTLTSPTGGLVLASGQLTVRAMSISAASIALSVAAAAVLLAWWAGTAWRRRHHRGPRRPAHARGSPTGT